MSEPEGRRQIKVAGRVIWRPPADLFEFLQRGHGLQVVERLVAFAPQFHNLGRQCAAYGGGAVPAVGDGGADSARRWLELSETCGEQEEKRRDGARWANYEGQTTEHNTSVER